MNSAEARRAEPDAGLGSREPTGRPTSLQARGLTKRFGDLVAVRDLDLDLGRGEVLALLGPNGAGKTTTIRMLCGLLQPDAGQVQIGGAPLVAGGPAQRRLGVCPQRNIIWERLTCLEQLTFVGTMYGCSRAEAKERALRLLGELGLAEKARVQGRKLSGGMQRRLSIALALVHDPDILFLDEPEAGLDPQSRVLVREYVARLAAEKAVVLTTHNMDEADRVATRVAIIDHGAVLAQGTQGELKRQLGEAEVLEVDLLEAPSEALRDRLAERLRQPGWNAGVHDQTIAVRCAHAAGQVGALLDALRGLGVKTGDVRLRQPTLEDVFLTLTGRRLRE